MPLTDNQQALIVFISAFFIVIGTAAATLPNFVPQQYQWPIAFALWIVGIIGLALKEALGAVATPITTSTSSPGATAAKPTAITTKILYQMKLFARNTSGMAGVRKGTYDPDPRPKHHKGRHRRTHDPRTKRSRVPPQLRAWVFGRRHRSYDPRPRRHHIRHRRYDPRPKRSYSSRIRHYGSKVEGYVTKYGTWIGGILAAIYGVWYGINEYSLGGKNPNALHDWVTDITGGTYSAQLDRAPSTPEITHLANFNMSDPWNVVNYLKYKFTGQAPDGSNPGSAWVVPFWAGLISWLGATIVGKVTHKGGRILRPIAKIGKGATIMGAVGALALPGSPVMATPSNLKAQTHSGPIRPVVGGNGWYQPGTGTVTPVPNVAYATDAARAAQAYIQTGAKLAGGARPFLKAI